MFVHLAQPGLFLLASGPRDIRLLSISVATVRFKAFNEKLQPSLPHVGAKSCPAVEGGAESQVNHQTLLALDLNSTDPLLIACTLEETRDHGPTPLATTVFPGAGAYGDMSLQEQERPGTGAAKSRIFQGQEHPYRTRCPSLFQHEDAQEPPQAPSSRINITDARFQEVTQMPANNDPHNDAEPKALGESHALAKLDPS